MLRAVPLVPFLAVLVADANAQQTILVPQNQPTIEAAIAAQPLHLDSALTLQLGAVASFTVLVP